jgi:hypothetical protein
MDPGEESRSFILPENSWHLYYQLPRQCKSSKDESQKPPVLTVTKTLKAWEADRSTWQERAAHAQKKFKGLPQKELQQCLAGEYDAIMELRMVKLQDEGLTAQTAGTSEKESPGDHSDERSRSTIPQKRPWAGS